MRSNASFVGISIFLAVFLVTSCGSPSGTSEPEASGTMVAVIDGTRWQGELMAETAHYFTTEQELRVNYFEPNVVAPNTRRSISLLLRPVNGVATVVLGRPYRDSSTAQLNVYDGTSPLWDEYHTQDSAGLATLTEFDPAAGRFAGTFAFVAIDIRYSDTVRVADGTWTAQFVVVN